MNESPIAIKKGELNQWHFSNIDSKNKASKASTNANGTNIFCMEYFYFKGIINSAGFKII